MVYTKSMRAFLMSLSWQNQVKKAGLGYIFMSRVIMRLGDKVVPSICLNRLCPYISMENWAFYVSKF